MLGQSGPASCCCWKMWFRPIKPRNGSVITEKHSRNLHVLRHTSRLIGTRLWIQFIAPNMPALLKQVLQNAKECPIFQLFCGKIVGTSMYKTTGKLTMGLWNEICTLQNEICTFRNGNLYFAKWKSVLCEMKICTLRNENLYFAKWKTVLCEMKICTLRNETLTQ